MYKYTTPLRGCQSLTRQAFFAAHIGANFSMTFPAAQRVVMLPLYSPASLASLSIPMAGPYAPNLRISFAIPKRLSTVLWESISEGKAKAEGHAMRTPVRLLVRACLIPQREDRHRRSARGFAMGMLWFIIASYGIS